MQPFLLLLVSIGVCNAFRLHEAMQKYKLSLSAAKTSKREVQFRELMDGIVQHSDEEIELIKSKRNRAIFNGAKAASQNERVVDAFIVLYEDLAPLRIAGNMIFSYLTAQISAAVEEFEKDNKQLIGSMSAGTIKLGRAAFKELDRDKSGVITRDELSDEILKVVGFDTVDEFMVYADTDKNNELNFEEFMLALIVSSKDAQESIEEIIKMNRDSDCKIEIDDDASIVAAAADCVEVDETNLTKYDIRFDNMLTAVAEWEEKMGTIPLKVEETEGRMRRILNGCFFGAKEPAIVLALRTVYVDFTALRMAGDLIFKLLKKFMK
ncbi:hypothetical protein ScalyP_jg6014 [Parmales sp. scaly parma]|nr:hypothetical protein ScalyP_jg6014 [Parmales sp. scaly parma]